MMLHRAVPLRRHFQWLLRFLAARAAAFEIKGLEDTPMVPTADDCRSTDNPIVRENCLPGSSPSEWDINGAGSALIQGFATDSSYAPGDSVDFKIKTQSQAYRLDIYRLGWYAGLGARMVDSIRPSVKLPQAQPDCLKDSATLLVDCATWAVSASWNVPNNAVSGVYIARLVLEDPPRHWRTDASQIAPSPKFANKAWDYNEMPPCGAAEDCPGLDQSYGAQRLKKGPHTMMRNALKEPHASHVHFVIREDHRHTDILFQTIDTTSRAYNTYDAPSTYGVVPLPHHNFSLPSSWHGRRAYKVSYNTPLLTRDTRAVNTVFNSEFPAIRWLEKHGFDIQYWTGVDAHKRGSEIQQRAKAYLSVGHDEYWSRQQRLNVEDARDEGVHLLFWSGNEVYWKVRWEASPVDNQDMRTMVVYKESQESFKIDPNQTAWTGTFRDSRGLNPEGSNPENSLTGTIFTVNAWRNDPLEVPAAYSSLRFWRDTGVANIPEGRKAVLLKGLLGHEWDEDIDNGSRPPGLIRLSETVVDNVQLIVDAGGCFDSGSAKHHLVLYKASSGALVFGAGTVQWSWGLDNVHDDVTGANNMLENEYNTRVGVDLSGPDLAVQQATINLFADMGIQPELLEVGLVRAKQSSDLEPPKIADITFELKDTSTTLLVTATDVGGVVAAIEWSMDQVQWHPMAHTNLSRPHWWHAPLPTSVKAVWLRAVDDSLNIGPTTLTHVRTHAEL